MSRPSAPDNRLALCRALWSWPDCPVCERQQELGSQCTVTNCPGNRLRSLDPFFRYYEDTAASYVPDLRPGVPRALDSLATLSRLISHIKQNPTAKRGQLAQSFFAKPGSREHGSPAPREADQYGALCTALKVMGMVDVSAVGEGGPLTGSATGGSRQTLWSPDDSYAELWGRFFREKQCPELEESASPSSSTITASLCARELTRIGKLKLVGTSDLRNHLRLDGKSGTLEIFHHTSVLKEHLYGTRDHPGSK